MHSTSLSIISALVTGAAIQLCAGYVAQHPVPHQEQCTKTTVAILGGGMAGITAAQALSNASVTDFIILEYRDTLGGRVWHADFGQDQHGAPYRVEYGANWVQGLGSPSSENPIWRLAQKHQLLNTKSDYDSLLTYNETGYADYSDLLARYAQVRAVASQQAGRILNENHQDMTARSGLALAGWRPRRDDMAAQAVEWWNWDWEVAYSPEATSFTFGIASENLTFNQFGDANNFVLDPRGFSSLIHREAASFLTVNPDDTADDDENENDDKKNSDPRLWLNSPVTTIEHTPDGVTIHTRDGSCVSAAYAICTFSLGVLQNHAVTFSPPLPVWKQTAIAKFNMGTYTKIFLQFPSTFWPRDTQFLLYADPTTRGYFPVFQSLSTPDFFPDSNILFVTVVENEAYRIERQSDQQTQDEILRVLRNMFPDVDVPDPIAFAYPRWSTTPWSYGSYSNWPTGTTLEMHENLRANVDRLWFAGEATSAPYFGFLHGAWFEGREAGEQIASLLREQGCTGGVGCAAVSMAKAGCTKDGCGGHRKFYDSLHGTTPIEAYSAVNGWGLNSTNLG